MKNYRILSKKRIKRFVLAGLVPVISLCSIVFSSLFAVQVKANSLSADTFNGWTVVGQSSTGDSTLGVGNVSCSVGSYVFNVPFSFHAIYNDRYLLNDQPSGSSVPDAWTEGINKWYYIYNYNLSEIVSARIIFPASFLGKVINGVVSVTFTLNNGDTEGYPQLYYKTNTRYTFPFQNSTDSHYGNTILQDSHCTFSLSTDYSADGVIASLSPSSTDRYYTLNVSFNDYYVPMATAGNTTVGILDIPMNFVYTGSLACGGTMVAPYSTSLFPPIISSMLLPVNPYNTPSTSWRCNITGASFLLDNDYYTLLHALADTQYLTNAASNIASIQALLAAWVGSSDPASIPVDFADLASAILTYLQNNSDSVSPSDLTSINNNLASLVSSQGREEQSVNSILSKLSSWELSTLEASNLDTLSGTVSDYVDEEHYFFASYLEEFSDELIDALHSRVIIDNQTRTGASWYSDLVHGFYLGLGPFALVISVVLFAGILLRIIGKVH